MGIRTAARLALIVCVLAGALTAGPNVSSADAPGGELVEEALAHEVGANAQIRLNDVSGFNPDGGDAVLEAGTTNEESFSYDRVDGDSGRLIGLTRPDPAYHAIGSLVEAITVPSEPTPAPSPSASSTPTDTSTGTDGDGGELGTSDQSSGADSSSDSSNSSQSSSDYVIPDLCDTIDCGDPIGPCSNNTVVCAVVEIILNEVQACLSNGACTDLIDPDLECNGDDNDPPTCAIEDPPNLECNGDDNDPPTCGIEDLIDDPVVPCGSTATLTPPAPLGHEVTGSATYSCTNKQMTITVVGCLHLNGLPVDCDGASQTDSPSASVDLSFPCLPGVWTTSAIGTGAGRALPAPDLAAPAVVIQCDPL